jgi:hypothetical protein
MLHKTERSAWWKSNRTLTLVYAANRRARRAALPDTFTETEANFMLTYWHFCCAICGNQRGFFWSLAHDHWIPLASPQCPGTIAENIIPLCHGQGGCNNSKADKDPVVWLKSRYSSHQVKRILAAIEAYFAVVRSRSLNQETG